MRYQVIALCIIFLSCFMATAYADTTNYTFPTTTQGQFVYYHDTRGNSDRLTGILKYSNNEILCRTINLKSGTTTTAVLKVRVKDKEFIVEPVKVIEGDINLDMQYVVVDFMNIATQYNLVINKISNKIVNTDDEWPEFGYTLEYSFIDSIPLFNLLSIRKTDLNKPLYEAVIIGRMQNSNDPIFLDINSLPAINKEEKFKLTKKTSKTIELNGIKLILDDNWKYIKGNSYPGIPHDTYWISQKSFRDAQIGIEQIDLANTTIANNKITPHYLGKFILGNNREIIPSSIIFNDINNNETIVQFTVVQPETNYRTYTYLKIMKIGEFEYKIVNFSTYSEVYEENKEYFDTILKSIVLK